MSDVSLAAALAGLLLGIAGAIALTPVKYIQSRVAKRSLAKSWGDDLLPAPDEISPRDIRQEVVSALMRTYLHDRVARDHLQLAAATQNLHPIGPEDVLTQLIFIRRDLNRVMRDSAQSRSYGTTTLVTHRSEYFYPINETATPRNEVFAIKYFQQNFEVADYEASKALSGFQRKNQIRRKFGAVE